MAIELNVGGKTNINVQTANDSTNIESSGTKTSSKILDGKSLTVSSAAMSDLEKLVAQLKNETDNTKMSVTQQRISVLQTVLDTMPDRISEKERANLIKIEELNGEKSEVASELAGLKADKTSAEKRISALDVKIAELESAVERAIQDGEDHRKQVDELKRMRAEEQKKLDRINTAIESASSKIAGIDVKIAELTNTIAKTTLNEVANALRIAASDRQTMASAADNLSNESNADRIKKEKKEAATDIGNVIRESLDKIDGQMRKSLDEAQMKVEG